MRIFRNIFILVFLFTLFAGSLAHAQTGLTVNYRFEQPGDNQPLTWRLLLEFNQPTSVLELSRRVSLKVSGKEQLFTILNATDTAGTINGAPLPSERKIFVLEAKEKSKSAASCTVTIAKNLKSADGKSVLDKEMLIKFEAISVVEITNVEPFYHEADNRGVRFNLISSAPETKIASGTRPSSKIYEDIDEAFLRKTLRILPPIGKFSLSREKRHNGSLYVLKGKFQTGKEYALSSQGGDLGDTGVILKKTDISFKAKGPLPAVHFEANRSVLELRSRQTIPVSLTSISKVRCQMTRIPPLFGPEMSDLTLFARNDALRSRSSSNNPADATDETDIASAAKIAEQQLVEGVKASEKLAPLVSQANSAGVDLARFLGEFSQGSEVFFQETAPDKVIRLSLPLNFRANPENGGIVLAQLFEAEKSDGCHAARLLQVTDLSITYKFGEKSILVWVTSLETGKPVPGAEILVFQDNDHRLFLGKTDNEGIILAKKDNFYPTLLKKDQDYTFASSPLKLDSSIFLVAATTSDACFISLDSNRFRPYQVPQVVASEVALTNRNAHVFTERGIYKPGETIYWKGTLRKYDNHAIVPPSGEKVTVKIEDSKEETIFDEEVVLNEYGTCSGSLKLKDFCPLGQYNIRIFGDKTADDSNKSNSNDNDSNLKLLTETGFQVQKFERPRHFVTIKYEKKSREDNSIVGRKGTQDYLECRIEGKYYTGGPVKMAKVRWTAHLIQNEMDVKGLESYHFGGDGDEKSLIESGEGLLDKDGALTIPLPIDKNLMNGLHGVEISATVLDVDARPATTVTTYAPPVKARVGISNVAGKITEGEPLSVDVVVVDEAGQKIPTGNIRLEILKKRSFYTQKRNDDGEVSYHWETGWMTTISSEQLLKDGKATFDLGFDDGGYYFLQAAYTTPDGECMSKLKIDVGYSYSYEDEEDGQQRKRSKNEIVLFPSKLEAAVDEKVKIDFNCPRRASHALMTCERDDIFDYRVIVLDGRHGSFESALKAECRPNAFITATIPCGRSSFPVYKSQVDANLPNIYHGIVNIKVKNSINSLAVAIQPAEPKLTARPGETRKLEFAVTDKDGKPVVCEMAVCVVDEAVLALTGYVTPVLARLADFSLPLSIFSGDLRLSLISQELFKLFGTNALTGGDMGSGGMASDLALRKDFRPVAYWNPALMTDQTGKAGIEFKLPDSTTAYRIYAIALDKGTSFCSSERQMIVSKEFYIQPGLPRFMVAGDKAKFPLSAKNKTETGGQANLTVAEAKNLMARISNPAPNLTPLNDSVVMVDLEADNGAGEGSLTFSGKFGAFSDAIQQPLTIFPRYLPINRAVLGHFKNKTDVKVQIPEDVKQVSEKDRRETMKAVLGLSTTEWSKIAPGLRYLLRYPYGCVEQTSSGIIPLAGMRKLIEDGLIPGITAAEVDKFLKPGVNRLLSMQTNSGAFAYWPGDREPHYWGTLYAVFALTLAQEAGYDVPDERLTNAVKYIHKNLFTEKNSTHYHNYGIEELAAVDLALNKNLTKENLGLLMKDYDKRDLEGKAYLLWADAIIQATTLSKLAELAKKLNPKIDPERNDYHNSSTRETAAALLATLNVDPSSKRNDDFAGALMGSLKPEGRWYSTADTGICLFALSSYFKKAAPVKDSSVKVKVTQPGKPPVEVQVTNKSEEMVLDAEALLKDGAFEISADSDKLVNWNLNYSYPDTASRADDLGKGFKVRKEIRNLNGTDTIRVGDIVKVSVEFEDYLHADGKYGSFEYLAIEDPIPAGFVAINSALKTERKPSSDEEGEEGSSDDEEGDEYYSDWEDGAYKLAPDHFEMHDEKILAFKNRIWTGKFRFSYYARAVCEGEFWLRPSRVSLMYSPETYGLTPGETIRILPTK